MDENARVIQLETMLKMYMDTTNKSVEEIKKSICETNKSISNMMQKMDDNYITRKEFPSMIESYIISRESAQLSKANGLISFIKSAKDILVTVGVIALAIMQWGN